LSIPSLRFQPPVLSPITASALARAAARSSRAPAKAIEELSDELRARFSADEVLLTGSGTQALQLAIETATPDGSSDTIVALPAFCCYDIASAAVGANRRIVLYDLDPETLGPDLVSLDAAFRAGASAAVIAHLYGVPVPWEPVAALATKYGAVLIEDAAQGQGARWRGEPLGSHGEISVLSFGRGKGWTGGGGGALLVTGTARAAIPRLTVSLQGSLGRAVGALAQWALARPAVYSIPRSIPALGLGETHYHQPVPPGSIAPFSAALVLELATVADEEAACRRRIGAEYREALETLPEIHTIRVGEAAIPGWLRFPVRVSRGMASFSHSGEILRQGVSASYPTTLAALEVVTNRLESAETAWPGAEQLVRELITLPAHSRATGDGVRMVIGRLASNLHDFSHFA